MYRIIIIKIMDYNNQNIWVNGLFWLNWEISILSFIVWQVEQSVGDKVSYNLISLELGDYDNQEFWL